MADSLSTAPSLPRSLDPHRSAEYAMVVIDTLLDMETGELSGFATQSYQFGRTKEEGEIM